jgi:hypothetical protein
VSAGAILLYHAITAGNALVLGLVSFLFIGGLRGSREGGAPTFVVGPASGPVTDSPDLIDPLKCSVLKGAHSHGFLSTEVATA